MELEETKEGAMGTPGGKRHPGSRNSTSKGPGAGVREEPPGGPCGWSSEAPAGTGQEAGLARLCGCYNFVFTLRAKGTPGGLGPSAGSGLGP